MRSLTRDIQSAARSVATDPTQALRESVLAHLRDLCATFPGGGARLFHEYPASAHEMVEHLRDIIERLEPRLRDVAVEHVPGGEADLTLRFEIAAALVHGGRSTPALFFVTVDANAHVEVR